MKTDSKFDTFISQYSNEVSGRAFLLREILFANLPGIIEQIDFPAKMIAYCYGQKYTELICTIIPSRKGIKLGFNKGADLHDPEKLLEGTGKISRYVEIKSEEQVQSQAIKKLLSNALLAYKQRVSSVKK